MRPFQVLRSAWTIPPKVFEVSGYSLLYSVHPPREWPCCPLWKDQENHHHVSLLWCCRVLSPEDLGFPQSVAFMSKTGLSPETEQGLWHHIGTVPLRFRIAFSWFPFLYRKRQPTPVCLPGKFHGQKSLAGYSPWGHKRVRHRLSD